MPHITRPSYTPTNKQTAGRGGGGASAGEQTAVVQPSAYRSCTQSAPRRLISSPLSGRPWLQASLLTSLCQTIFLSLLAAVEGSRNLLQNLSLPLKILK